MLDNWTQYSFRRNSMRLYSFRRNSTDKVCYKTIWNIKSVLLYMITMQIVRYENSNENMKIVTDK